MVQGNYKLCMSSRPRRRHPGTRPSASDSPPTTITATLRPLSLTISSQHLYAPPCSPPACHSLSLASRAKLRRVEAATALRNSVIYWQFPSQVSGILYLNTSAATLNKTALSIYISPAPGQLHTAVDVRALLNIYLR